MCKSILSVLAGVAAIFFMPRCAEAQQQHIRHSFEVATVRPSPTPCVLPIVEMISPSGRLTVGCQPLVTLVYLAYFQTPQEGNVTGGEKWMQTERYDLVAKVDETDVAGWRTKIATDQRAAVRPLLQDLLAQRFRLKVHMEMRMTQVYTLVQSKGGAKLKQVDLPQRSDTESPDDETAPPIGGFKIIDHRMRARAEQISTLLWFFAARSGYDDAPLVDKTGLSGYYDFEMQLPEWTDKTEFEHQLDQQLGLRIRSEKVSISTIVIDAAEKPSPDQ